MECSGPTVLDLFAKGRWGDFVELDQSSVAQRFAHDLNQLRQLAGRPSYSVLERLSEHELRRTTMSDVLNGNRVKLPDWRFVHQFVVACRAAAVQNGLDANELGTVADWNRHWDGATNGVIDARFPGHGSQSFGRQGPVLVPRQAAPTVAETSAPTGTREPSADHPEDAGARPAVWGAVPSRLPDFVGREAWLDLVQQAIARNNRVSVVAIQGLFGVGKTQLAIEYANRHAQDYDLVWWVPCDDMDVAHGSMADLAARIGVAPAGQGPTDRGFAELFEALRRRQQYARWLLIFDNASEPEDIKGLLPPLSGDVLVTTRSSRWEASGDLLELDVFSREESIEFLRHRMRKFTTAAAHRLADGVGDLPLLLEHSVESHVPVNTYLARLGSDPLNLLGEQPADYHATIADVWRTAVEQLRADPPDALDLLRCLAFFGNVPVPRESLERGSYLTEVSIHAMLRDPFRRLGAIKKLRRAGLLRVRSGTGSFEVHKITRCVVRNLVTKSGTHERERARHDVHLLLAAADPLTPEDPATWRNYDELRGHAVAAGITACSHEMVRKLVVNLVRYLNAVGDPRAAVSMADEALAHWGTGGVGSGLRPADGRVAMTIAKADALFAQGRRSEAFQLRQEALAAMRSDPHSWAAEIIYLESMSGTRWRITGKFRDALAADRAAVRNHIAEFGHDDPRTFIAVNSLIDDLTLSGLGIEAVLTADRACRDCLEFYSDAGHPAVLAERNVHGRCLWLAGQYGEALSILDEVHTGYDALARDEVLHKDHPWRLVHEIDYAITRRDKGLMPADLQVLAAEMDEVRRRCWRTLGSDHPQTLAATVVLASILRRIGGRAGEAVRMLGEAERRYQSVLPGHPYCQACTGFLAAVRCQVANGSTERAAGTVLVLLGVIEQLTRSVGETHPLSLTAAAALANALARAGEPEAAVERGQRALAGFEAVLGSDHPHTAALRANIATIQSLPGFKPEQAALARGQLVDIDFTPLPLLPASSPEAATGNQAHAPRDSPPSPLPPVPGPAGRGARPRKIVDH